MSPSADKMTASIMPVVVMALMLQPTVVTFMNAHQSEFQKSVTKGLT